MKLDQTMTITVVLIGCMRFRQYLVTGRKHALIKKYALNKHVRLLTRLYGNRRVFRKQIEDINNQMWPTDEIDSHQKYQIP